MKKQRKAHTLQLSRETLHHLEAQGITRAAGGSGVTQAPTCPATCQNSCLQYITCFCPPG